ncbi:MAG: methylenetetrahydrofolate reductase C-terminal domain-containing protein, partial [Desulfobacterales bacterium]|nr:methylenetetrahydrofolate reductase C-terminal domain-containing protein [Desulfobacterales bacterium]
GCGTCVTVCLTGGEREAWSLARELANGKYLDGRQPEFNVETVERQCEADLVKTYFEVPAGTDAILSMACGAGVQTVAAVYSELPVIPALNTTFLGALDEPGIWSERCQGCGNCVLAYTAGICPVARCAKRLFNGPCGGSSNGKCEIGGDVDCAWQLIIDRLKARGRMEDYEKIHPPKDWSAGRSGGPRKMTKIIKNG